MSEILYSSCQKYKYVKSDIIQYPFNGGLKKAKVAHGKTNPDECNILL